MPAAENAHNIGSSSVRWEDLYVDDGYIRNIYLDDKIIHNGDDDTWIHLEANTISFREAGADSLVLDSNRDATFSGNVTAGSTSTSKYLRAYHSDASYTNIYGYGVEFSRTSSYIRPVGNSTQNM